MVQSGHIRSLDGLRGLAAFAVVLAHLKEIYPSTLFMPHLPIGSACVAIFFSLSGFLMAYLYGERRMTRQSAKRYIVHRLARIYPVYLVAVLFVLFLSYVPGLNYVQPINGLSQVVRHVLLLGSTGVFWSVPPEIQFYGVFLLVWHCLGKPERYQTGAVAFACLLAFDAHAGFPGPGIFVASKLHFFLFGVVAALLYAKRQTDQPPAMLIGLSALGLLVAFFLWELITPLDSLFWSLSSAFTAALIVYLVACEHPLSARLFTAPPLRFLGKISFSLYLFHVPVMFLSMKTLTDFVSAPVALAGSVVAAIAFASISYELVEAPARKAIVALWENRGSRPQSALTAPSAI